MRHRLSQLKEKPCYLLTVKKPGILLLVKQITTLKKHFLQNTAEASLAMHLDSVEKVNTPKTTLLCSYRTEKKQNVWGSTQQSTPRTIADSATPSDVTDVCSA